MLFLQALGLYLLIGALFAVVFVWRGAPRIDPDARGTSLGFRLLLIPGSTALWPLLLKRWMHPTEPVENNAHRRRAVKGS